MLTLGKPGAAGVSLGSWELREKGIKSKKRKLEGENIRNMIRHQSR